MITTHVKPYHRLDPNGKRVELQNGARHPSVLTSYHPLGFKLRTTKFHGLSSFPHLQTSWNYAKIN